MAARRNKSQARRGGGGLPGWAWLVIGLALGVAAIVLVPRLLDRKPADFFRPTPNPDAQPAEVDEASGEPVVADEEAPTTPGTDAGEAGDERDYDFYTVLPGKEVPMSDAELAASARAEQQRAAEAAEAPSTDALPKPVDEDGAAAPVAGAQDHRARYLLQAGAFEASGQAEELKAKIALLGLSARVESARVGDRTVFRVRLGPYGTARELAEAKGRLEGAGLQAMPIRLR